MVHIRTGYICRQIYQVQIIQGGLMICVRGVVHPSRLLAPLNSFVQVLMLYFQLTVRYSKMLADGPPHLVPKVTPPLKKRLVVALQDARRHQRNSQKARVGGKVLQSHFFSCYVFFLFCLRGGKGKRRCHTVGMRLQFFCCSSILRSSTVELVPKKWSLRAKT